MGMIRSNFYITQEQDNFLRQEKSLTISEHIRRALDEYIVRKKKSTAVTSPSLKGGQA